MEYIKLPPRLSCIAAMVPSGTALADIGTDHGLLPIRLLQEGRIRSAVASDIRSGPLARAKANAAESGVGIIRFVLCDGLSGILPEEAETVVIAGMGGETIASILEAAPWVRTRCLLLQPMSKPELLRRALGRVSMRITAEQLVKDNGKLYTVLKAVPGEPLTLTEAEEYVGAAALLEGQELYEAYLTHWEERFCTALDGLARSGKAEDIPRRKALSVVLEQIRAMEERRM